jgi:hypothetical protein
MARRLRPRRAGEILLLTEFDAASMPVEVMPAAERRVDAPGIRS